MLDIDKIIENLIEQNIISREEFDKKVEEYNSKSPVRKNADEIEQINMLNAELLLDIARKDEQLYSMEESQAALLMELAIKGVL